MEGESSAKRSRIDTDDKHEIIDITDSPQSSETNEEFLEIAKEFINDDSFFENNPTMYKVCQVYVRKMYDEWQKTTEPAEQLDAKPFNNFIKSHQILALQELFSSEDEFCGLNLEESLSKDEIKAAGIAESDGEDYIFLYDTIRDFCAAEYILGRLNKHNLEENCEKCVDLFTRILSNEDCKVVRMLIDDGLENNQDFMQQQNDSADQAASNLSIEELEERIIKEEIKDSKTYANFAEQLLAEFEDLDKFINIFEENLKNLVKFFINVFQRGDNVNSKVTLIENSTFIFQVIKDPEIIQNFADFIFEFLNLEDLKNLVKEQNILQYLPTFNKCSVIAKILTLKIEEKFSKSFVREALLPRNDGYRDLLDIVTSTNIFTPENFEAIFDILEKYLTGTDIERIIQSQDQNIFHALIFQQDEKILEVVWNRINAYFSSKNETTKFKKLILQKSTNSRNRTVLHRAADCKNHELHKTLWQLLDKTFESSKDLKELVLQMDKDKNNFLHTLVTFNDEQSIELAFTFLKQKLGLTDFKEVLQSKGFKQRNMIQKAADMPNTVAIHQCLWASLQKTFSTDEFKNILAETDKDGQNLLFVAASFSPGHVFDFMIQEIDKIMSIDEIRELLSSTNKWMENIFQSAIKLNFSQSLHESLWRTFQTYFDAEEIIDIVRHPQKHNCNLMHVTVAYAPKTIAELTWNEIKKLMNFEEQKKYLSVTGFRGMTLDLNCRKMNKFPAVQSWIDGLLREYELM